ncbi:MAG: alpha-amylase family glycosyl hydrolase, partial [Actinomycetota bacterium]|nr:alpha-amylase family glycosyl hydrolase [Actinomycetota bacterium]
MPHATPWWQTAVLYQVYPRSFLDSDGDGIGDLAGLRSRLPYLRWLGVDGMWLSPIYRSPMADFGYDVSDHCAIDPVFGDLDDFDALLGEAHGQGLRVLLDWVPNHTSDRHPWFVESRSDRRSPKRDWYFWRDGRAAGLPPNNWKAAFGGQAWTWDERTGQWYLHLFLPEQPDLNWGHPGVVDAMHGVLRFWLDRGVDGFRADVVHLIGKDERLPDQPPELAGIDLVGVHDHPAAHPLLRGIRRLLDSYCGDRVMVGEVNLGSARQLAPYYGAGDELHMVFNFSLLWAPWDPARWAARIVESEEALNPAGAWPAWVLSNHDTPRHRDRYGGSEARARVAATVLLTLRGTPFLYAGEELGLEDAVVPPERAVDPGGRDGARAPVPWRRQAPHGWDGAEPWLPWPPDPEGRSVEAQRDDPTSMLHLYRRLLAARRASEALRLGSFRMVGVPEGVVGYERAAPGGDRRLALVNFTGEPVALPDEPWSGATVEVASDPE